ASAERNMLLCAARPHMLHLSNVHKGTANLFIIEDERPVFLEQLFPANCVYVIRHVSDNDPLHRTATGKIALAYMDPQAFENYLDAADFTPVTPSSIAGPQMLKSHLEQIRLRGYSLENEELSEGVSAVSVPIFNHRDRLFGTISLTGASFHIDREKKALIPGLIKASAAISAALFNAPAESANQG
ncbi:MAG: IclR family transcriptional regulator, partial [Christensenellales bacterium]